MTKHARLLAVAPCMIFFMLAFVNVCAVLLQFFPRSLFLWWANIEIFSAFRWSHYALEYLVGRSPFVIASVLIAACGVTLLAVKSRNLAALFLLNHSATLLVVISCFSQTAHLVTAEIGAAFHPLLAVSFALSAEPLPVLFGLLGTVSCVATHWMFVKRCTSSPRLVDQKL